MVHRYGPQCADTTAGAGQESAAGQWFLIGDASVGSNPSSPARLGNPINRLIRTGISPQTMDRQVHLGPHLWTMQPACNSALRKSSPAATAPSARPSVPATFG